ncbi:MAG: KpsF/GutQ family sugar-phosphate isomerase [Bacteroidota bacterium]|nr:KpsF/GutQ family sugar-phosphate isomerase [Bacteroidota bacterium]
MNLGKNIKKIAIDVLLNEAEAIKNLIGHIDDNFSNCVEAILDSKGRVIITGIGKSAHIAHKIVATLNSTGTPSMFLHAADAIHGDLGMVQQDDTVIFISKSGNTPEIKVLLPLIKRAGAKTVALVSRTDSFLARNCDYLLNATVGEEACPHNLAPTTSTTAHLAMGDALAVCLLESRGFTSADFAKFHPGGSLGKKLYLKVDDIYPMNEVPVVQKHASVKEIIMEISSKRLGATAVIDELKNLIGIITDGDLRRMLEKHTDLSKIQAIDVMSPNPKVICKGEYAVATLAMMQENNIAQLIVTENSKVVGFIHLHDLLKEGIV